MSTNNFYRSDLNGIFNLVQSSMVSYPKEKVIGCLREYFSYDSYYHCVVDEFGFENTPDHTDLPLGAGMDDNLTTRLFIGENYRFAPIYYPCILVKNSGFKYVPISMNRNSGSVKYDDVLYYDGYGNSTTIKRPTSLVTDGANEGSLSIDIMTRSLRSRDDLVELTYMYFVDIGFDLLVQSGIIIKPPNVGSPNESDDRNDKLFKQTINLEYRTEWRREIPVGNIIESIFFAAELHNLKEKTKNNLDIETSIDLLYTI